MCDSSQAECGQHDPLVATGLGLNHLVYLTHDGTLSDVCVVNKVTKEALFVEDVDVEPADVWWGCCCRRVTKTMKLSHAKGISKRISEVNFYELEICILSWLKELRMQQLVRYMKI